MNTAIFLLHNHPQRKTQGSVSVEISNGDQSTCVQLIMQARNEERSEYDVSFLSSSETIHYDLVQDLIQDYNNVFHDSQLHLIR